jgi:hypothetical protein
MIGRMTTLALAALLSSGALAHGDNHGKRGPAKPPSAYEETDWGRAGDPKRVTRTIKIDMNDRMRFTPSTITVRAERLCASSSGTRASCCMRW